MLVHEQSSDMHQTDQVGYHSFKQGVISISLLKYRVICKHLPMFKVSHFDVLNFHFVIVISFPLDIGFK
jgi:hypothetical protein